MTTWKKCGYGSSAGLRARRKQPSTKMKLEALKQGRELFCRSIRTCPRGTGHLSWNRRKGRPDIGTRISARRRFRLRFYIVEQSSKGRELLQYARFVNTLDEIVRIGGSGALS